MLRLMVMRSGSLGLASLALATACTGAGSNTEPTPDTLSLCRAALPDAKVVSATPDTVRSFRAFDFGPGNPNGPPLASAFPSAKPNEQGLWCWTENQPLRSYTAWAVVHQRAERAYTAGGDYASPPSGRPVGG
jgi:hypothetical protein